MITDITLAKNDSSIKINPAVVASVYACPVICIPWARKVTPIARIASGMSAWTQWTWARVGRSKKKVVSQPNIPWQVPIIKMSTQGLEAWGAYLAKKIIWADQKKVEIKVKTSPNWRWRLLPKTLVITAIPIIDRKIDR